MAVLLLDIDNFKEINDLCGHQVGDTVLMDLAKIFVETFRKSDIICRYGGDEFLVLMPESGTVDAEQKMTLFQSRVNELSIGDTDDEGLRVSVCCGIAGYPEDGTTTEALIAEADRALYQAKKRGPGSVYIA
jgi:diguanylate cyclase (GGDEF)-like protein